MIEWKKQDLKYWPRFALSTQGAMIAACNEQEADTEIIPMSSGTLSIFKKTKERIRKRLATLSIDLSFQTR